MLFAFPFQGEGIILLPEDQTSMLEWISRNGDVPEGTDRDGELHAALLELMSRACLISEADYRVALDKRLCLTDCSALPTTIRTVAIPTKNRRQSLNRCIESYLGLLSERINPDAPQPSILVLDDGDTDAVSADFHLPADSGTRLLLLGRKQKEEFFAHLISRPELGDTPEEVLRFGFFGSPGWSTKIGANRNWALLSLPDEPFLFTDDDETSNCFRHPDSKPGLRLSGKFDPADMFFDDQIREMALKPIKEDILSLNEALLGSPL